MKKLIRGLREFQETYFVENQALYEELAHGQSPRVLFITCSDSRLDPNLMLQAGPGELFVIRNAGNLVPPYGAANGGEGASIEYAIQALNVDQIIICGHSHCGAMKGLLKLKDLRDSMPLVCQWLEHAMGTLQVMKESYQHLEGEDLIEATIAENVVTQIENIKTYPAVHSRLRQGKLEIFGWIYEIETGEVLAYDEESNTFAPPSTQLGEAVEPGSYVKTAAPVVPESERAARNAVGQAAGNGIAATPSPWVTPAQADRIYRGATVAR
jgi:carbonic anhydrase